jgi:hypothetical protein
MSRQLLWGLILFPAFVLGLLAVKVVKFEPPRPGRACYTHQDVHPFSRDADTVTVTVCFRGTGAP